MIYGKDYKIYAGEKIIQENNLIVSPSAEKNMFHIVNLVSQTLIKSGNSLEIASGSGQHIVQLASSLPNYIWQPTDVDQKRITSIDHRTKDNIHKNIKPARYLDATQVGWSLNYPNQNFILLINLLHLISWKKTKILINEIFQSLSLDGILILYGPFMRDGKLTSKGDIEFHKNILEKDSTLGYKDNKEIKNYLLKMGFTHLNTVNMPANNLAFIFQKLSNNLS
ncbi:DUF938 domain-containing protein [Alphaproteobacteria bacterium]|nr:DUF938 domain-containing protein [Alphaproteobacteria bacterium]